jgi:hypothetical protein
MAAMEQWLSALPTALPVPPWAAAAGGALLLLLLLLALAWLVGFRRFLRFSFTYGLMIAILGGGYYAFRQYENINQRRSLEERANALFNQIIQPGSPFACIDGSPAPAMQAACERTLFAEPQRVATAVAITTQRVAYMIDAVRFGRERDGNYLTRISPLRRTLENDPFGFVGFVMSSVYHCMADLCDRFAMFDDPERVKENIRSRRYEAYMAKYAGVWRGEPLPEDRKTRDVILPGVAIGDKPQSLIPLDAGPPALFDPVPRGNPIPSGPILLRRTTPPAAATPPDVTPPPTVGGPPRARIQPESKAAPTPARATDTPFRPIAVEPDEEAKGQKKAAPKAETAKSEEKKGEEKSSAQKKSAAKAEPKDKGSLYRPRGNEPVAGLPRLVPGDYRRPDPNEPPDTPTPSGVIMSPNP